MVWLSGTFRNGSEKRLRGNDYEEMICVKAKHVSNVYDDSVSKTLEKMRKMDALDFQDMIVEDIFDGTSSGVDKDGIDGYVRNGSPIQVKRSDKVGKNVMVSFEFSMRDVGKKRGYVVAFSFTNSAYGWISVIKKRYGVNIILRTVEELLRQNKYPMSLEVTKKRLTKNYCLTRCCRDCIFYCKMDFSVLFSYNRL